jgi:hypothetical protein
MKANEYIDFMKLQEKFIEKLKKESKVAPRRVSDNITDMINSQENALHPLQHFCKRLDQFHIT